MARSTTTYVPKWQCGKTCVIRVPAILADEIMTVAGELDAKRVSKRQRSLNTVAILAAKKTRIRALQRELDHLRGDLGFSTHGEVLFASPTDSKPDGLVVVIADGFGGAVMNTVAGNYPIDFQILSSRRFASESKAIKVSERITFG